MAGINSYEELMQVVSDRAQERLVLEVELGTVYSQEYEDAKEELKQAKALRTVTGEQQFLSDNVEELKKRVEELKPEAKSVWLAFKRIDLKTWSLLVKKGSNLNPVEQYERVLPDTFIGVFGDEDASEEHLLSDDYHLVSYNSDKCIMGGGVLQAVVQSFMSWQNTGGDVTIHPTK